MAAEQQITLRRSTSETLMTVRQRCERAMAQLEIDAAASSGQEGSTLSLLCVQLMIPY